MLVEERTKGIIPEHLVEVGDYLRNCGGWTRVKFAQRFRNTTFVRVTVDGHSIDVTANHPFTAMDENSEPIDIIASRLTIRHQLFTRRGAAFVAKLEVIDVPDGHKMLISCEDDRTFFAGEDEPYILSHNMIIVS